MISLSSAINTWEKDRRDALSPPKSWGPEGSNGGSRGEGEREQERERERSVQLMNVSVKAGVTYACVSACVCMCVSLTFEMRLASLGVDQPLYLSPLSSACSPHWALQTETWEREGGGGHLCGVYQHFAMCGDDDDGWWPWWRWDGVTGSRWQRRHSRISRAKKRKRSFIISVWFHSDYRYTARFTCGQRWTLEKDWFS